MLRASGIDRIGDCLVALGAVDVGVGGAIDHHVTVSDDPLGRSGVGDIPLRGSQRQHIAAFPGGLCRQMAAQLPARTGDD